MKQTISAQLLIFLICILSFSCQKRKNGEIHPALSSTDLVSFKLNGAQHTLQLAGISTGAVPAGFLEAYVMPGLDLTGTDQSEIYFYTKSALESNTTFTSNDSDNFAGMNYVWKDNTFDSQGSGGSFSLTITEVTSSSIKGIFSGTLIDTSGIKYIITDGSFNWANGISTSQNAIVIGDSYEGGIAFYVDSTGKHGLICANVDQTTSSGIAWDPNTYGSPYNPPATGANGTSIGTGAANTDAIYNIIGAGNNAVSLCKNYQGGGYSDWYLPSKDELNQLWLQRNKVGGFAAKAYWSSSEDNNKSAWAQNFDAGGYQESDLAKISIERVRAIRSF
jgi:hypothetical protein